MRRLRAVLGVVVLLGGGTAMAAPPAQRLPSALLVYPLIVRDGSTDTRIEIVNLSSRRQTANCFYLSAACSEMGFFITLTPNQPLSWLASAGYVGAGSAIPPFFGSGELKCVVLPDEPEVTAHNALQGRAVVFGADGQETAGYGAVGFRRLSDGEFTRVVDLDGVTYENCPDEQHFVFLATEDGISAASQSELIITPCSEDLANQIPGSATVQFRIVNEFEQRLSASTTVTCHERLPLADLHSAFTRSTLGSATGHLIVRGVQMPVIAFLIDRFRVGGVTASAMNEPVLDGGRSATVTFP